MIKLEYAIGVVVAVAVGPAAIAVNITFDSGSFGTNGNAVTGNINDIGPIPGLGTHSRFATDGSTLTMDATSSLALTGFQDLGWTMTYTNTAGFSTATLMDVTFTVLNPITYTFSGTIDTNSTSPAYTYSDVFLQNLTTTAIVFYDNSQWSNTAVVSHTRTPDVGSFAGSLIPGHQCLFSMYLQTIVSSPNTDATFDATFDLVFVPGPGAVTLWCFAGVLGALRRRRSWVMT